jgi:hypothetical protein
VFPSPGPGTPPFANRENRSEFQPPCEILMSRIVSLSLPMVSSGMISPSRDIRSSSGFRPNSSIIASNDRSREMISRSSPSGRTIFIIHQFLEECTINLRFVSTCFCSNIRPLRISICGSYPADSLSFYIWSYQKSRGLS